MGSTIVVAGVVGCFFGVLASMAWTWLCLPIVLRRVIDEAMEEWTEDDVDRAIERGIAAYEADMGIRVE